ncbi:hypothetical protein NDU88_003956 [Pleurodeles waltl]|uniref:Uncharacterized protein n=1 Tax=Pleurodeles waltl TaxID=8319 RepID=A0AAV7UDQ4_PLEWA|nr:hypothetical protein NDU88_003956 [Pleurodeles waltl]
METLQPLLLSKTRGGLGGKGEKPGPIQAPPRRGPPLDSPPHLTSPLRGWASRQSTTVPAPTKEHARLRPPAPSRHSAGPNAAAPHTMPLDSVAGGRPPGLVYCACRLRAPHRERPTG